MESRDDLHLHRNTIVFFLALALLQGKTPDSNSNIGVVDRITEMVIGVLLFGECRAFFLLIWLNEPLPVATMCTSYLDSRRAGRARRNPVQYTRIRICADTTTAGANILRVTQSGESDSDLTQVWITYRSFTYRTVELTVVSHTTHVVMSRVSRQPRVPATPRVSRREHRVSVTVSERDDRV